MDQYRDYLYDQGLSPKTVRIYSHLAGQARTWCQVHGHDLDTIRGAALADLTETIRLSSSRRYQFRCALGHYWTMIDRPWPHPLKAITVPRSPRPRWRGIEPAAAGKIVRVAQGWDPAGTAVLAGLYLGLRRQEIAAMEWRRFDRDLAHYTVLGKGGVTRTLPVHPVLQEQIQPTASRWVFPGRESGHVHGYTVHLWLQEACLAAEVTPITPHQMRHTAIAMVCDQTGDLAVAQEFAGHSRPETTRRYTRVTARRLQAAILALDYLAAVEDEDRDDRPEAA